MSSDIATILRPKSIAVIGASEDQTKFGGRLYRLLLKHNFAGTVYPINPNRPQLFGLKTYPNLAATPTAADMVVMAVPRHLVQGFVTEAAAIGVRAAIVITAKFSDEGPEGAALEAEITRIARASAASNSASTEWAWTVANTSALVVPWRNNSSQNAPATSRACAGSAKAISAGKICRSSQSSNCSPCAAMLSICG